MHFPWLFSNLQTNLWDLNLKITLCTFFKHVFYSPRMKKILHKSLFSMLAYRSVWCSSSRGGRERNASFVREAREWVRSLWMIRHVQWNSVSFTGSAYSSLKSRKSAYAIWMSASVVFMGACLNRCGINILSKLMVLHPKCNFQNERLI